MQVSNQRNSLQQSQYNLYHLQDDPFTLTITKKTQIIKDLVSRQATYVWLDTQKSTNLKLKHKQIQRKAQVKINFVNEVFNVKQQFQKQYIILISHSSFINKVKYILQPMIKTNHIKSVVLYGERDNNRLDNKIEIRYVQTQQEAIKIIRQDKYINSKGDFNNFISLQKQIWDSNILVKTMFAMINQTTSMLQLVNDLVSISKIFYPAYEPDASSFLKLYQKNRHLNKKQAVRWYQKQSFLYRLVNRLLRISRDPTCLYIIQPYFKDLFYAIKKIYRNQQQKSHYSLGFHSYSFKKFICYRGGQISQEQIQFFQQNKGGIIQNLGFMSTSRSQQQMYYFIKNALFEIQVDDELRRSQLDYGFADISMYCEDHFKQEEILFNPLNSFKIIDIQQNSQIVNSKYQKIFKIKLKFGEMARIAAIQNGKLSESQQSYKHMGQHQIRESQKCTKIGDVLIQDRFSLEGCQQYWNKFIQIAEYSRNLEALMHGCNMKGRRAQIRGDYHTMGKQYIKYFEIAKANKKFNNNKKNQYDYLVSMNNLGVYYYKIGSYFQATKCLELALNIKNQILNKQDQSWVSTYNNLGSCFLKIHKYQKSKYYLIKCLRVIKASLGENNLNYANTLNNLGVCFLQQGKFSMALSQFKKSQRIQAEILGQFHPDYTYTLYNLGCCFLQIEQYQEAILYLEKCQYIRKKILGQNHPNYSATLLSLGSCYLRIGHPQKALDYLNKCELIHMATLGQNHPNYITILNNIGKALSFMRQQQKALYYYKKCLMISTKIWGVDCPDFLCTTLLNNIQSCSEMIYQSQIQKKEVQQGFQRNSNSFKNNALDFVQSRKIDESTSDQKQQNRYMAQMYKNTQVFQLTIKLLS